MDNKGIQLQQAPLMELKESKDLKEPKEPKEKKDKKDKKDKKEKKEKKEKKKDKSGAEVDDLGERFRPVPNPLFTQSPQDSPLSSTKSSEDLTSTGTPGTPTPTELQGYVSQKYMPSSGYAHLDPSKYENSHSAFDNLQKLIQQSPPQQGTNVMSTSPNKMHPQQQPRQESHSHPPLQPLPRLSPQQRPPPQQRPSPQQQQPYPQQPRHHPQQPQQRYPQQPMNPQQRPPQQRPAGKPMNAPHKTSPGMPQQIKSRPDKMPDGAPVIQYARGLWSYTAQIPSELSFEANDQLAILNQQPDNWWYAELLDPKRRRRGLVPGNYMAPI
ncbi:hypothetical protein K501DRAFT_336100 [Backusella circina FSU 941]|nr:hypothetical protein K501DRAFT_336100 [Backusella circina FSU 941]